MNKLDMEAAISRHRATIDQPIIVVVGNPLDPQIEQHDFVAKGVSVAEHLANYDLVTVPRLILYNSEPLLEADWDDTTLNAGDVLMLMAEPGILFTTVALIVMASLTLIMTAYSLYSILTLDQPEPGQSGQSPNYSVGYRGNRPRPGQPMPVVLGTIKTYPDLSGQFSIYRDNEQILYQLFDVSLGEVDTITAADIYYEDTRLDSFTDYEIEHVQPGQVSDLFPNGVQKVDAVADIELITAGVSTQPYVVNPIDRPIRMISFTISSPSGSFSVDDKGRYVNWNSYYLVEFRDANGGGGWTSHQQVIASTDGVPVNQTATYAVTPGLSYEARVTRTEPSKSLKTQDSNDLFWTALLGIDAGTNVKETTRLAVKIRASNALGNAALSKMNVLVKRRLPVWTGSSWTAPQQTNLAAWAFADICRAYYGGRHGDSLIDLDKLLFLASEGAEFNGIFDDKETLFNALNSVARVMNGRAVQLPGGVFSVVQDLENQPPTMLFNSRNIVANTYGVEFNVPTDEDINFVRCTYKSAVESYREVSVDCTPFGVTKNLPYEVRLRGVTDNDSAFAIGIKMATESKYRRKRIVWESTLESMIPRFGDVVRVASYTNSLEHITRTISGEVQSHNGSTVTVYEDLSEMIGQPGLEAYFMNIDGSPHSSGAASVTGAHTFSVGSIPQSLLVYGDDFQGPKYAIGEGSEFLENVKITKVSRVEEHRFKLEGVQDHPGAYADDEPVNYSPLPSPVDLSPKITNLKATLYGTDNNVKCRLIWDASGGADYFIVDMLSIANPVEWAMLGRPTETNFNALIPQEDGITLRVRGVSLYIGTGSIVYVDVLSRAITYPGIYDLRPKTPFTGSLVSVVWNALPRGRFAVIKFIFLDEVVREQRVDENTTEAFITADEIASVFGQSIQGQLFPAVGCRTATIRMHGITYRNGSWLESPQYTELIMKNEPMRGVQELKYRELFTSLSLSFVWPDPAPGGVYVFLSTQLGFQPGPSNLVFFGNTNSITLVDSLPYPGTVYVTVAGFDVFGPDDLVYSPQVRIDSTQSDSDYILPPITDSLLHSSLSSRIDEIDGGQEAGFGTGLLKQWTVKIDPGGSTNYVSGFGLAVEIPEEGPATSEFLVLANRFGVADPGSETFDFIVEGGQVRMNGAKIGDASILNASIKNAAVDTLKIKDAAVTAQYISQGLDFTNTGSQFLTVNTVNIPNLTQGTLRIDWQIGPYIVEPPSTGNYDRQVRVIVDNTALGYPYDIMATDRWDDGRTIWRNQWGYNGLIYVTGLSTGSHSVKIQIRGWPNGVLTPHTIVGSILTVTEAKK